MRWQFAKDCSKSTTSRSVVDSGRSKVACSALVSWGTTHAVRMLTLCSQHLSMCSHAAASSHMLVQLCSPPRLYIRAATKSAPQGWQGQFLAPPRTALAAYKEEVTRPFEQ